MNTIPERELVLFNRTVNAAIYLAWNGWVAAGFGSLYEGLRRTEELERYGERWAADLAARYRGALDRYAEHYGGALIE